MEPLKRNAQDDPWDDLLPLKPHESAPRLDHMLRLIIYDITNAKRLRKVAIACEDFGSRVQFSVFECWMDDEAFARAWGRLESLIDPEHDRIACYTLDRNAVRKRCILGTTMELTQKQDYYLF